MLKSKAFILLSKKKKNNQKKKCPAFVVIGCNLENNDGVFTF